MTWFSAMISACWRSNGTGSSPQILSAKRTILAIRQIPKLIAESPCRTALRRATDFPAAVRGPRLLRPLLQLAAILANDDIAGYLPAREQIKNIGAPRMQLASLNLQTPTPLARFIQSGRRRSAPSP